MRGGAKCEFDNAPHSKDLTCIKTMVVWQEESEVSFNFNFVKPTGMLSMWFTKIRNPTLELDNFYTM